MKASLTWKSHYFLSKVHHHAMNDLCSSYLLMNYLYYLLKQQREEKKILRRFCFAVSNSFFSSELPSSHFLSGAVHKGRFKVKKKVNGCSEIWHKKICNDNDKERYEEKGQKILKSTISEDVIPKPPPVFLNLIKTLIKREADWTAKFH